MAHNPAANVFVKPLTPISSSTNLISLIFPRYFERSFTNDVPFTVSLLIKN